MVAGTSMLVPRVGNHMLLLMAETVLQVGLSGGVQRVRQFCSVLVSSGSHT